MKTCKCGKTITSKQAWYSLRVMGSEMCSKCQMEWREKNHPPKMADFMNNAWKGGVTK